MNEAKPPLPPGQQLAAAGKWPIVGERRPAKGAGPWSVEIGGLVDRPRRWLLSELAALEQAERVIDIHCVTRWSIRGARFSGVPLARLLDIVGVDPQARFVSFIAHSDRRHSTSLSLAAALGLDALVALTFEGMPLATDHGGPVRVIVPDRYFYKSVKWLARIVLLRDDRLGYWEAEAGYHNVADPWLEQRYLAPSITKQDAQRLISQRNFAGRDLRGIDAAQRDLTELNAERSLLRDANFRDTTLLQANFRGANLSNAHLERAALLHADFTDADCEGANFSGADLRGANFSGASLLAATFSPDALVDAATLISDAQIATLMPAEAAFLESARR